MKLPRFVSIFYVISTITCIVFLVRQNQQLKKALEPSHYRYEKNRLDLERQVAKVVKGDAEASYNLLVYYNFVVGDPIHSYFWAMQARRLGHVDVSDKDIMDFQSAALSALGPKATDADLMKTSKSYTELPDIEREEK